MCFSYLKWTSFSFSIGVNSGLAFVVNSIGKHQHQRCNQKILDNNRVKGIQFLEHFDLALDLRGSIGVVAEAIDEYLNVLTVLELRFVLALLVLQVLRLGLEEVLVVAAVALDLLVVQVHNLLRHRVQEAAVVRHDQQCALPVLRQTNSLPSFNSS